jgi:16S rRNA (uracil1498-N3)-methyltransferase
MARAANTARLIEWRSSASAEIKAHTAREAELPFGVTLAQALPGQQDGLDHRKGHRTGRHSLPAAGGAALRGAPVGRAGREEAGALARHHRSAAEQCGRNRLAQLAPPQDYKQWITQQDLHRRIILTPRAEQSLADWARHQAAGRDAGGRP